MKEFADGQMPAQVEPVTADAGRVEFGPEEGVVSVDGSPVPGLSGRQRELLSILVGRGGLTVPATEICEEMWGEDSTETRACLSVHLLNLRRNLGDGLGNLEDGLIETVIGVGYRARTAGDGGPDVSPDAHKVADERVAVDPESPDLWVDERHIDRITMTEYRIARELARRPDRIVGLSTLINIARDDGLPSTPDAVRNHIKSLRIKLGGRWGHDGPDLGHHRYGAIRVARGIGYFAVRNLEHSQA